MLEEGLPAVEVMSEYVRACRQLGHLVPEPTELLAAYTAEESMDLGGLAADSRALRTAVAAAEEAVLLQDSARRAVAVSWHGAGAEVAADFLRRHADSAAVTIDGLRCAAAALDELADRLRRLVEAKVDTTLDIEARGSRDVWLGAARTVTTGAGDRATASELVDLQVAPFVVNDVGVDWVSSMRDTEAAIRQAYSAAAAAAGAPQVVFDIPGQLHPDVIAAPTISVPSAQHAAGVALGTPAYAAPAVTAPASFSAVPAAESMPPAAAPNTLPPVPPAPPIPTPSPPVDPLAGAQPPSAGGGFGGLGSMGSGLSGLGQSFADTLGGLLGSGGAAFGERVPVDLEDPFDEDPLDEGPLDEDEVPDENDDVGEDDELDDDEEADELGQDGEPQEPAAGEVPLGAAEAALPLDGGAPVESAAELPVPTPVPEPLPQADAAPAPAEPIDAAEAPCEIAADELPQAGP